MLLFYLFQNPINNLSPWYVQVDDDQEKSVQLTDLWYELARWRKKWYRMERLELIYF
jgi:hypothetical protein